MTVSPDGKLVAAGSLDTMVRVWNVQTGQQIERLKGHKDSVYRWVVSSCTGLHPLDLDDGCFSHGVLPATLTSLNPVALQKSPHMRFSLLLHLGRSTFMARADAQCGILPGWQDPRLWLFGSYTPCMGSVSYETGCGVGRCGRWSSDQR